MTPEQLDFALRVADILNNFEPPEECRALYADMVSDLDLLRDPSVSSERAETILERIANTLTQLEDCAGEADYEDPREGQLWSFPTPSPGRVALISFGVLAIAGGLTLGVYALTRKKR